MSEDPCENVKISLAKVLNDHSEHIRDIIELEDAEANLQNAAINEIDAIYSQSERTKQTKIPIVYDRIYLSFIDDPDPWHSFYESTKVDLQDPELMIDKSEDKYLDKDATIGKNSSKLPKIV